MFFTATKVQMNARTTAESVFGRRWSLRKLEKGHLKHLTPVTHDKGNAASVSMQTHDSLGM